MRGLFFQLMVCVVFMGNCFAQKDSVPPVEKISYDQQTISPVEFDDDRIASYKKDEAFNYERIQQENWWTLFKEWIAKQWNRFWDWLLGSYTPTGIVAFFIKILPYLIAVAILGFAIWLFIKLNPASGALQQKKQASVNLSEDEKIIEHEDISALIQKAKKEKNYRLAVRYYYLLILKKMRDLELIDYQFQKTNEEYLKEIAAVSTQQQFKAITHIYDFIWYGDFPVNEADFIKAEKDFSKMQTTLNTNPHGEAV